MTKKEILTIGTVLLILIVISILYQNTIPFSKKAVINIFIPSINDFKIVDTYKTKEDLVTYIEAKKDEILLKIRIAKITDEYLAKEYMNYHLNMINSTYEPIKSPYPGSITRERACPEELKLIKVDDNFNSTYYLIYSTNRYSYGACSWDSVKYRVVLLFRYCEYKKELYQVEIFIPVDESNESYLEMAEKIKCKQPS